MKEEKQTDEELREKLSEEAYNVLRHGATEAPFSGKYLNTKEKGIYKCAVCGAQLFSSDTKFESGTGWPSFDEALPGAVEFIEDRSHGMTRTEVRCSKCGSHLGHVFDDVSGAGMERLDGKKAEKRYCINSVCLDLEPKQNE